jgi:4-amino-4-deoxy-L-arabinose transferase-like glycosyltransferase
MKTKVKILLFLIVLLSAALRFWKINEYPAGFNADEAAYAYNAYSLIQTGKDEFGARWPLHLKSFADYKPAGTAYLMIPFIKFFGLNETAARLPSLLAGVFSVLLIFLLVQELFNSPLFALVSAFFLAISPWHIHFSRGAWETNIGTTFLLLGVWLFFKGLKNPKYLVFCVLSFAFSIYTYHTPRVIIPLLGLFFLFFSRKTLFKNLKWLVIAAVLGGILMIPFIISLFGPAVSARFSGVSLFSDIGPYWRVNYLRGEHKDTNSLPVRILHNRPVNYALKLSQNWLSHFDGSFLFVIGDKIKRSNSPEMGEMYLFDLIFLLSGVYFFIKIRPKNYQFIFFWLLVAPVAASLTFQTPNALRAHNMVIPLVIISAYGFYNLTILARRKLTSKLFTVYCLLFTVAIAWNTAYFLHQYFVHYPKTYHEAWEYGMKDLVSYLEPINKFDASAIKDDYSKVYVTEQYDQPYILFLFYLKYPPEKFQKEAVLTPRDKFGFSTVRDFDNFHFEKINWEELQTWGKALVCGTDEEIPDNTNIIKTINFKNGEPAFQCVER